MMAIIGGVMENQTPAAMSPQSITANQSQTPSSAPKISPVSNQRSPIAQFSGIDLSTNHESQFEGTIQSMEQNCCLILKDSSGNTAVVMTMTNNNAMGGWYLMPGDKISFEGMYFGSLNGSNGGGIADPSSYPSQAIASLPPTTPVIIADDKTDKVISLSTTSHSGTWTETAHGNVESDMGKNEITNSLPFQITAQRWRIKWTMTNHVTPNINWSTNAENNKQRLNIHRVKNLQDVSDSVPIGAYFDVPVADGQTISGTYNMFGPGTYFIFIQTGAFNNVTWSYQVEELQ